MAFDSEDGGPPEPFLWGVATSAYQSEGGYNGPRQPQTNWAKAELAGDVAATGAAAEFWSRYGEDFAACRALGLNAFRLGWEWSRGQPCQTPQAGPAPAFDLRALDHYADMTAAAQAEGLEPVVTLQHFVHPAWLGVDAWQEDRTVAAFERWVATAVAHVNARLVEVHRQPPVRWYITLNEPNMLVANTYFGRQFPSELPGGFPRIWTALNRLLAAHVRAYNAIHDLYAARGWERPRVAMNTYCFDLYWSDKLLLDLLVVRERGLARADVPAHLHAQADAQRRKLKADGPKLRRDLPFYLSALVSATCDHLGKQEVRAGTFDFFLDELDRSPRAAVLDYIGLDYYDPFAAHSFRLPVFMDHEFRSRGLREWVMAAISSKWWDWRVLPEGLHFFCDHYSRDLGRPVLIAENGMALRRRPDNTATHRRDRMSRSEFLRLHVSEVERMAEAGVPVVGYLHWSLFDNYEWGTYTPRFGLFAIDYAHGTDRQVEDHLGDRPSETYAALVAQARRRLGR